MNSQVLLEKLVAVVMYEKATDLHLIPGYPPTIRKGRKLKQVTDIPLKAEHIAEIAKILMGEEEFLKFTKTKDHDFSYEFEGKVRFRINAYYTFGKPALALRVIPTRIRSISELNLPEVLANLPIQQEQGLILVVGPTGHGKSTTIASMINIINQYHFKHIVTLEDPIEYIFPKGKSIVSQREVHYDAPDFYKSLRNILREDPDVVFIGEMRDAETIESTLIIAETGHLVFSTLHTYSASQTIERIVQSFTEDKQTTVRMQLAYILKAVISQRLLPTQDGGVKPAVELLINNSAIRNLIREGKFHQIDNVIKTSLEEGMFPLEYSLAKLVKAKDVTLEEALKHAIYPEELKYWINNV